MKNLAKIVVALCFFVAQLNAQATLKLEMTKAPCKSDGIIKATVAGIPNPESLTWIWYYNGTTSTRNNIASGIDSIIDFGGGSVYLSVFASPATSFSQTFFTALPFTIDVNTTIEVCPKPSSAEVKISGGTAPFTYVWKRIDNGSQQLVGTTNPINLPNGQYLVKVTDANGCYVDNDAAKQDTNIVYIEAPAGFTCDLDIQPANCTNGSAKVVNLVGGKAPFSYLWSNGATSSSIQNLTAGNYPLTITDANGCSLIPQEVYVRQFKTINVQTNATPSNCNNADGSILAFAAGGTNPYTYKWSNSATTQQINNLSQGSYNVEVVDAEGCRGQGYAYLNNISPVVASFQSVKPSSCTQATGEAILNISGGKGPYTVVWATNPVQTGNKLSGVLSGNYAFVVKDANSCQRHGSVFIGTEFPIYGNLIATDAVCKSSTGSIAAVVSGGVPPFSYQWNTGATTPKIDNLSASFYAVTVTDAKNCVIIKSAHVNESSPLSIALSSTPSSCIFSADGSISSTVLGGTAPYTYQWSNGKTSSSISGLSEGGYNLYVTDANGCASSRYTKLDYDPKGDNCYCTIQGYVYHDVNNNCIQDAGEPGVENIQIHCQGRGYVFTDEKGYYSFKVPSGNYTISETINSIYPLAACQNNNNIVSVVAASGCKSTVNFANKINPLHDTHVSLWSDNYAIPGFEHTQNLVITNAGTIKENDIIASYVTDNQIGVPAFIPNAVFTVGQPGYYSANAIADLAPGKSEVFRIKYTVPVTTPLNTELYYKDTCTHLAPMANWLNDYSPWNNVNQLRETVVGSYDPNFIQVSPKGLKEEGYISKNDSTLEYMVHFQNYGNYFAQNVVVKCQLDPNLRWTTVQPIYSTNPSTVTISETGLLTYTFKNINLYPKTWNEELSKGFFTFSVKAKPGLVPLTKIQNLADIYFDYNEPVRTNTALNTIEKLSSATPVEKEHLVKRIYPNPASDLLNLELDSQVEGAVSIQVTDIFGRLVHIEKFAAGNQLLSVDTSPLSSGMYLFTIAKEGQKGETHKVSIINE